MYERKQKHRNKIGMTIGNINAKTMKLGIGYKFIRGTIQTEFIIIIKKLLRQILSAISLK